MSCSRITDKSPESWMGRGSRARRSWCSIPWSRARKGTEAIWSTVTWWAWASASGEAAAQVDEVEVQGDGGLQLHGAAASLADDQVADLKHLGVGQFVHQAPQVVEGPAVLRGEIPGPWGPPGAGAGWTRPPFSGS